jgi:hypothetical protein
MSNYLKIDSVNRHSGTASDFQITLPRAISRGQTYELSYAHIPMTQYNITTRNNIFRFDESGVALDAILTPGFYSAISLTVELKRAMEVVGANTYIVSIVNTQFKVQIVGSSSFQIYMVPNHPILGSLTNGCFELGFGISSSGTTHTGSDMLDLEGNNSSISIDINDIIEMDSISQGCTFNLPINVNPLQVLDYSAPVHHIQTVTFHQPTNHLKVRLKDSNNETIDLNSSEWYLILKRVA